MSKIYPAIDLVNGQCVRLVEGNLLQKTIYEKSPLDMVLEFEKNGAKFLHLIDLDAAFNRGNNQKIIREICSKSSLRIQVGGGIKTADQIENLLNLGAERVIIGSLAVRNKSLVKQWIKTFGSEKIIIAADTIKGKIAINGWQGVSDYHIEAFISDYIGKEMGLSPKTKELTFLCTEISKDGKLGGCDLDLYKKLQKSFPKQQFIASGGVSSLQEIKVLQTLNISGIIVGKALYEKQISLKNLFAL